MQNSEDLENDDYIIKTEDLDYEPNGGMGYEFFRMMKFYKNNIAQYVVETEEEETYETLLKRCIKVALKMKLEGIKCNDLICLCTYNHRDCYAPFLSAIFLGAKIASLDPSLSVNDSSFLLKQVKPSIIFVVPEAIELIEKSIEQAEIEPKLVIFGTSDHYQSFSEYLEFEEEEDNFKPVNVNPQETAVIFFSSGTTGLPKGICQSHYAILAQAVNIINNGLTQSTVLYYSSLYWISSVLFLTVVILNGGSRVVCTRFDPKGIWQLIEKYKIGFVFLAPIQAIEMYMAGRPEGIDTSHLLHLLTSGGVFSEKYLKLLRDILPGTTISQAYGQTEVAGTLTQFKMNDVKDNLLLYYKPNSCGKPIRGVWYKVVDPETRKILGPYQQGELLIKSRFVMNGYHNIDSSDAFDSNGWLKTGDIVYYDEDQCFYIIDRVKEMLKYKSWHIPPAIIENVLNNHSAIKKAIVIGIPHEEDGDHPMAVVILKKNQQNVTEKEIEEYVAERVQDRQKIRGGVKFVDSFPITPSGKIKRQEIKKMVLMGDI